MTSSTNGTTWTARTTGFTSNILAIIYNDPWFVAGSQDAIIRVSQSASGNTPDNAYINWHLDPTVTAV
jgi:hypothetical protein